MPPLTIDIHTHILPRRWPSLRDKYGYGGWIELDHHQPCGARMLRDDGTFFREVAHNCWDAGVRLEECDSVGVSVQVLSTVPVMFGYWAKPEHTHDLARFLNDSIAEIVRAHPARFVGLGTLPIQRPELGARELERCVKELGLAGCEIGSHINDWNLDARELDPFWSAASELGAAVFVHPWDMMGQTEMRKYWLPWLVGMPAETSRAICSVIFGGVLERFPTLKLCFAHGGGSFPGTIGRVQHGFDVRPDLCACDNDCSPRSYLALGEAPARFWVDSLTHDADALRRIVQLFGDRRVALGSDYPFPLGEREPGALIRSIEEFSEQTRRRLLAESALEFLGLDADAFA